MTSDERYPLNLGDGGPIIWCRDARQAEQLLAIWRAAHREWRGPFGTIRYESEGDRPGDWRFDPLEK